MLVLHNVFVFRCPCQLSLELVCIILTLNLTQRLLLRLLLDLLFIDLVPTVLVQRLWHVISRLTATNTFILFRKRDVVEERAESPID